MPAPKMPDPLPSATATAAAEALDGLLATRAGWTSTDRGWHHKKTGIHIEARAGTSPFRATVAGADRLIATRAGLELFLQQAGA